MIGDWISRYTIIALYYLSLQKIGKGGAGGKCTVGEMYDARLHPLKNSSKRKKNRVISLDNN